MKDLELHAMPGRKLAHGHDDEWTVSAYAGRPNTPTVTAPSIQIASFFGPEAEADAGLFASSHQLYTTLQTLETLVHSINGRVNAATGGALNPGADLEVMHCLAMAKLARWRACGQMVARVTGQMNGQSVTWRMTIDHALYMASLGGVFFASVDLVTVAPMSDPLDTPMQDTVGSLTSQAVADLRAIRAVADDDDGSPAAPKGNDGLSRGRIE